MSSPWQSVPQYELLLWNIIGLLMKSFPRCFPMFLWTIPGHLKPAVPTVSPPKLCSSFQPSGLREWCASTAQQLQNLWHFINTILAPNAAHDTLCAAVRKVNSIPARPSTAIIQNSSSPFAKNSNAIKMFYCLLLLFVSLKGH